MGAKKWPKPCKLCKGEFPRPCMFCGHHRDKNKPPKMKDLTPMEQAKRRGKREYRLFMHGLDCGSIRGGNCSVDDVPANEVEEKARLVEAGQVIDRNIEEHRQYCYDLYVRHKRGESLKDIAEMEELTENIVRQLVQTISNRLNGGYWQPKVNQPARHVKPEPFDYKDPPEAGGKRPIRFNWT